VPPSLAVTFYIRDVTSACVVHPRRGGVWDQSQWTLSAGCVSIQNLPETWQRSNVGPHTEAEVTAFASELGVDV
jgi:hypothetical protein